MSIKQGKGFMKKYLKVVISIILIPIILSCKSSKSGLSMNTLLALLLASRSAQTANVTISGKVVYEFPTYSTSNGLNLSSPTLTNKNARQIQIQILGSSSNVLATGNTDDSGNYKITFSTTESSVTVRANARVMANSLNSNYLSSDTSSNVLINILDNTSGSALWSVVSSSVSITTTITQNLTATHSSRAAGAFAILGTELDAYDLLKTAESGVTYTKLNIYWSPNNSNSSTTTSCPVSSGCIGTSYYSSSNKSLYILGKSNSDTDEYDSGVIAHEFGHYVEDTVFRSDSIGGSHSSGQRLDPRLAFGEGYGNAFGSIVRNDSIYYRYLWNK